MDDTQPLAVSVERATELSGQGRSAIYALLGRDRSRRVKVGRRTLIPMADVRALLGSSANIFPIENHNTNLFQYLMRIMQNSCSMYCGNRLRIPPAELINGSPARQRSLGFDG